MDALQESLHQMMEMFGKRMESFEQRQASGSPSSSTDTLAQEFATFKSFVVASLQALQSQIEVVAKQVDQLEMRGRRKILLLHGLPEDPKEDISAVVLKTLTVHLKLSGLIGSDLVRCYRMGRTAREDRPRPTLFELRDEATRGRIWSAKSGLKGSGKTLSEFLTKSRHEVFVAARQKFGIAKSWTRDGFVFVLGPDGSRHRASSIGDLAVIAGTPQNTASRQPPLVKGATKVSAPPLTAPSKSRRAAATKK